MSSQSWYTVLNKDNVVVDGLNHACFSSFGYWYSGDWTSVTLKVPGNSCVLSEKQIIEYVEDLNEMGFICSYEGIKNDYYVFNIPSPEDPNLKNKKGYTLSIMVLLREMYHYGLTDIVEEYFKQRDKGDKFAAIQLAQNKVFTFVHTGINKGYGYGGNSNHCLSDAQLRNPITKEAFYKRISAHPKFERISMTGLWSN